MASSIALSASARCPTRPMWRSTGSRARSPPPGCPRARGFAAAGRSPRIAVAQGPTPRGALRLLERRGYEPEKGTEEHIYCYDRARLPLAPAVDGLTVERVGPEHAAAYTKNTLVHVST